MAVRWGLVSTALINELILDGARASDRVEVVAVASRSGDRAAAYAARHAIPRAHAGYDALLADPDVEAVYISTPNDSHVELTMRALGAGKHVLVEKPFSRRAVEVEAACRAADAAGLVLSEAFMWRHLPQTARLVELIAQGAVGPLVGVRARFTFNLEALRGATDTRFDPALDGGSMMDVGCYCLSGIRLVAGEPLRVSAEQRLGPSGIDVAFAAAMRMPGDVLATFDCSFVAPRRTELEVLGSDGTLLLRDPWHGNVPVIEIRRDDGVERLELEPADPYRLQLENVSDAIRGAAELRAGPRDAIGQARAIEALYHSAGTGTSVIMPEATSG